MVAPLSRILGMEIKDKKSLGVQYFNYLGYGHVRADYCNLKNSKDNAMDASLSD